MNLFESNNSIPDSPSFYWEHLLKEKNYSIIAGVDEAGRGPLSGPVIAAAVIITGEVEFLNELNDSKKINEKQRAIIYKKIISERNIIFGIGGASALEIDRLNILQATFLAFKRAVFSLRIQPVALLIDGNRAPYFNNIFTQTVIKGDQLSYSIAAASIIAKETRDMIMCNLSERYPEYEWNKNKGYPTKRHKELIKKFGISKHHRLSFKGVIK